MSLTYRKINYQDDIIELIDLLRTSLSDRQTSELFLWKHFENPFGKSYGLLAIDNNKIVGARMFMFWEFSNGIKTLKAIRPVDTITHPKYRGQGIFKKLTLQGLEDCRGDFDIIFNTPNENSYPGYLKMGWEKFPLSLNFKIAFLNPFKRTQGKLRKEEIQNIDIKNLKVNQKGKWSTKISKEYLAWRYRDEDYNVVSFQMDENKEIEVIIIYRLQSIKGIKSIVLIDSYGSRRLKKTAIQKLGKMENTILLYYLEDQDYDFTFSINSGKGKVVVKNDSKKIKNDLKFSIGDMEGRL